MVYQILAILKYLKSVFSSKINHNKVSGPEDFITK